MPLCLAGSKLTSNILTFLYFSSLLHQFVLHYQYICMVLSLFVMPLHISYSICPFSLAVVPSLYCIFLFAPAFHSGTCVFALQLFCHCRSFVNLRSCQSQRREQEKHWTSVWCQHMCTWTSVPSLCMDFLQMSIPFLTAVTISSCIVRLNIWCPWESRIILDCASLHIPNIFWFFNLARP